MRAHWEWWTKWLEDAKTSKTILPSKPGATATSSSSSTGGSTTGGGGRPLPPPPQGNAPGRTIVGHNPLYTGTRPPASASIAATSVTRARCDLRRAVL